MSIKLPKKIRDCSLVYSDLASLRQDKASEMIGRFAMIAVWDAKAENNYYDCYFIALIKEPDGVFVTLQYQRTDPAGVLDVWAAPALLRMALAEFDLSRFIWQIKEHRMIILTPKK